ncbi:hypothetical protein CVT26_004609 [Gymnopilus dilepis]|uniref:Uncharacterized protein n=1 Tax=Gymnopilus dilepis TaxID=231916 RepID=A0A409XCE9_9AGAR|nr:hypothetical protein CVT26_004609 [Gymnopilus dilepis]
MAMDDDSHIVMPTNAVPLVCPDWVCGDPSCRRLYCTSLDSTDLVVYYGPMQESLPLEWRARFVDGFFFFAHDDHLIHLTDATKLDLEIFSPHHNPPWVKFNQHQGLARTLVRPIVLKRSDYDESKLLDFGYWVRKVYSTMGLSLPGRYDTPAFRNKHRTVVDSDSD